MEKQNYIDIKTQTKLHIIFERSQKNVIYVVKIPLVSLSGVNMLLSAECTMFMFTNSSESFKECISFLIEYSSISSSLSFPIGLAFSEF